MSRAPLLGALAAVVAAGAPTTEAAPPLVAGRRRRDRRYYNPETNPAPMNLGPTPRLRKKKPHSTEDFAAIGRAVSKRERKAERRLRECGGGE